MKDAGSNRPQPNPMPVNLDESELVSNQNAIPVPWFAGMQLIAVQWIGPVYNITSQSAGGVGKK
jgi:hypothetical protein